MLDVNHIIKQLPNGKQLLKGISFSVSKGEFVGILGPSGAGKTLTMRSLNGLLKPPSGSIKLRLPNDHEVDVCKIKGKELRHVRQHIGVIFQGFNLVRRLTAIENVMIGRLGQINKFRSLFYGFTDDEAELALEALKKVKIEALASRKVESMSGGEMQRVAIARAMFQTPVLLLADEPVANTPANMADSAEAYLAVRDGWASFFYHLYLDPKYLREAIVKIKALGYTFVPITPVLRP